MACRINYDLGLMLCMCRCHLFLEQVFVEQYKLCMHMQTTQGGIVLRHAQADVSNLKSSIMSARVRQHYSVPSVYPFKAAYFTTLAAVQL